MRRFARWTLNALTALSLLLCTVTVALRVRNARLSDDLHLFPPDRERAWPQMVTFSSHGAWFVCERRCTRNLRPSNVGRWTHARVDGAMPLRSPNYNPAVMFFGVSWQHDNGRFYGELIDERWWQIVIPKWLVAALSVALPAYRLPRALRHRGKAMAAAVGLCPACGYDLRATPNRCPECGRATGTPA